MIYLISGFFFLPFALFSIGNRKEKTAEPLKKGDYFLLAIIGALGAGLAPFLFFEGLDKTSASNASVLEGGELLFTVVFALFLFKEKLNQMGYLGIIITIIGITAITLFDITGLENGFLFTPSYGDILIVLSTVCWGIDNNLSRIISKRIINTSKIVFIKSIIGAIILLITSYLLGYRPTFIIDQLPYLLILGIGGFGLSLFFFIESLRVIGTLKAIVIFSSSTLFGLFFSFIFLNEKIGTLQVIAALLVILGLYIVNKDELRYLARGENKGK